MSEDEDLIEISEEEVKLNIGGTRLVISGILSKRHAQILAFLVLAMLGYNHEMILDMI
tara:strand:- start:548 stop:721 length:174 start_codon:yes stop_codon:yes gene_type:complete